MKQCFGLMLALALIGCIFASAQALSIDELTGTWACEWEPDYTITINADGSASELYGSATSTASVLDRNGNKLLYYPDENETYEISLGALNDGTPVMTLSLDGDDYLFRKIEDGEQYEECSRCYGIGYVVCVTCQGTGKTVCTSCQGHPVEPYTDAEFQRILDQCTTKDQILKATEEATNRSIQKILCIENGCNNGYTICHSCFGKKMVQCPLCSGTGKASE